MRAFLPSGVPSQRLWRASYEGPGGSIGPAKKRLASVCQMLYPTCWYRPDLVSSLLSGCYGPSWAALGAMESFLAEEITVETAEMSPRPVCFKWRGETYRVMEVVHERVDTGFGKLPAHSRKWYTRRHRRYYIVRDSEGTLFEIYLDYANRKKQSWWLLRKWRE